MLFRFLPLVILFTAVAAFARGNDSDTAGSADQPEARIVDNFGYLRVAQGERTKAIVMADSSLFEGRLVLSLEDALQGELAGVRIVARDGRPGNSFDIVIRGTGTIYGSTTPLYVVDGLPMRRLDISPRDIATIAVLKDAASTALYGAEGGNGVVVITTRRGSQGGPQVSFDINNSVQTTAKKLKMMNSYQYQRMRYDALSYFSTVAWGGGYSSDYNIYRDKDANYYYYPKPNPWGDYETYADPSNPGYVNTDWTRDVLRPAFLRDYSLRVAGSAGKLTYAVMGGHFDQDGIVRGSGHRRWSARANMEYRFTPGVAIGANLSMIHTRQSGSDYSSENGVLMKMLSMLPTIPYTKEFHVMGYSPYMATQKSRSVLYERNTYARMYLDARLLPALKSTLSVNYISDYTADDLNDEAIMSDYGYVRCTEKRDRFCPKEWMVDYMLNYTPQMSGPLAVDISGGVMHRRMQEDFDMKKVLYNNSFANSPSAYSTKHGYDETRETAFLTGINASLWRDVLISASLRISRYKDGPTQNFAAFSAGWRFAPGFMAFNKWYISIISIILLSSIIIASASIGSSSFLEKYCLAPSSPS